MKHISLSESSGVGGTGLFLHAQNYFLANSHQNSHSPKIKMAADLAAAYTIDFIGVLAPQVGLEPTTLRLTSYVERQNLTMRMQMRRFTRLTSGFSKKAENHAHAVALHYMHYNYCRVHQTLRVTPAMEAGLTDHVWSVEEVIALLPKPTVGPSKIDRELFRRALGETA